MYQQEPTQEQKDQINAVARTNIKLFVGYVAILRVAPAIYESLYDLVF